MYINNELLKQFKEPINPHLCDSGAVYGYNYKDDLNFKDGASVEVCSIREDVEVSINTFMYLNQHLEKTGVCYDLDEELLKHINDPYDCFEYETVINDYFEVIRPLFNTYNFETSFNRMFQGVIFAYDNEYYIYLQTHNGCDVRGGYSKPQTYLINDIDYFLTETVNIWFDVFDERNNKYYSSLLTYESYNYFIDLDGCDYDNNEAYNLLKNANIKVCELLEF